LPSPTNKADGDPDAATLRAYDAHSAKPLGSVGGGPMLIFLKLHVDMFAGQPGKLFLGAMGFLFLVAIISGVVLYWLSGAGPGPGVVRRW